MVEMFDISKNELFDNTISYKAVFTPFNWSLKLFILFIPTI